MTNMYKYIRYIKYKCILVLCWIQMYKINAEMKMSTLYANHHTSAYLCGEKWRRQRFVYKRWT